ncbi:MAG: hypothetical protein JO256_14120 [Alphaproteobacteria bacterium]|nr:hypothetical protein [Alphaproteobacteria bacterium]
MAHNLAADIYSDATGKKWTARITRHLVLKPILVWEKTDMRSQWQAETSMDAAWKRIVAADVAAEVK